MPKFYIPRFLTFVGYQKVLLQSTLQMLLELLVLTTLSHPFGFLFSELEGNGGKFNTHLSLVLYLAGLCEDIKLEVRAGTSLIYQCYKGIIGSNAVAFIGGGVGDIQVNLSAAESTVNAKVTEDLLCFVYNDRG